MAKPPFLPCKFRTRTAKRKLETLAWKRPGNNSFQVRLQLGKDGWARRGLWPDQIRGSNSPGYRIYPCYNSDAVLGSTWIELLRWENLGDSISYLREGPIRTGEKAGLCKCSGALFRTWNNLRATSLRRHSRIVEFFSDFYGPHG